ncbi:hypothetical protein KR054_005102 [Drosophila jambulina]|nr:hypothetical protein KR054_005102 [Drosophila jambulina]
MDELSGERLADYKLRFEQLKRNERGVITINELGTMVRSMGENPTDRELEEILRASDLDGNGEIDFKEYCFVMAQFENDEEREMCSIFKMFDRDGDGYISEKDLLELLDNTDYRSERKAVRRLIGSVDGDGDGQISYDEFVALMRSALDYPSLE